MIQKLTYAREKLGHNIIDVQYYNLINNQKNTLKYIAKKCQVDLFTYTNIESQQDFYQLKSRVIYNQKEQGIDPKLIHLQFGEYLEKFQIIKETT